MESTKKRAHQALSLEKKLQILQDLDRSGLSKTEVAKKFNIPKSTLSRILEKKEAIEAIRASSLPSEGTLAVRLGSHECDNLLHVVSGRFPSLMGRGLKELRSTTDINAVSSIQDVIAEYRSVFDNELGTFKGAAAKITLQDNAEPRFFKTSPCPVCDARSRERQAASHGTLLL
ncbi:hypothetical protein HPB50_008188 [Hyalomma asiaticum]|uniref:Uncharacterized protein n=1 Tax=Hyalomma asiaticum TaxID=266040 RepID=A0ACB7SIX8_HYAAI|nr:hypothetical protein HPB50_008188 [Hyalomma asiaticum]